MNEKEILEKVKKLSDIIELKKIIESLRVLCANKKNKQVLQIVEEAINASNLFDDKESLVNLYELKIKQMINKITNFSKVELILNKMKEISETVKYRNGLALVYQIQSHIEFVNGNLRKSNETIKKAIDLLSVEDERDSYTYNICTYSFAVGKWLSEHNSDISTIIEENLDYFYKKGLYRSFAQAIAILNIIYMRMQNSKKILENSKKIFSNKTLFEELPLDVKGISYFFSGVGCMLDLNLNFAESYFKDAYNILKPIHKESIYFSNFIILHSFLCTVTALQGKLEKSLQLIEEAENLLKQEFFEKNLDLGTKKQIYHTLNLNKFYVYSRLKKFDSEEMQDLIEKIFMGSKTLYSDFLLLSEFMLNANLVSRKIEELLSIDNFSLNRVKHIILFTLQKENTKEESSNWRYLQRIEILNKRKRTTKTTFIENVFADLLIAQQLFSLKRYEEIYPLLRKYEKKLQKIEVLELRIFMEAFIQVGAYKSGDPLGPALQYIVIKKCRHYGFGSLESILLNYLDMQYKDIQSFIR
ncbi:MAG: hypothetical protein HGN29_10590 [Asgard group archaeon]|nr:hypothetical protein [Asgard group archaeon]